MLQMILGSLNLGKFRWGGKNLSTESRRISYGGTSLSKDAEFIEVYVIIYLKMRSFTSVKHKRNVGYIGKQDLPTSDTF